MSKMKRSQSALKKATAVEALQLQLDTIGEALDASQDGFAIWKAIRNPSGAIENFNLVLMNKAGADAAGKPQLELVGKTLVDVVGAETSKGLHRVFELALKQGHGVRELVPEISPSGFKKGVFENTVVPFGSDLVFATYREVSKEQRELTRLTWLSEHDFLTGMPNRTKLFSAFTSSLQDAQTTGNPLAFVYIDIDFFKLVNDTYGHEIGDAVLVNFVKRIQHSLPDSALVARIAGDEFAVLLSEVRGEQNLRDLMDEVFSAMDRPFTIGELKIAVTCSAGCILADGTEPPETLLRIADAAMYQAKQNGRNRYLVETSFKPI